MKVDVYYNLYAKFPGQSTFRAMDLGAGQQVGNLIYASLVPGANLEKLKEAIRTCDGAEPGTEFQLRGCTTKKVRWHFKRAN